MNEIDVFIQGTDINEIAHLKLPKDATVRSLRKKWSESDLFIFAEDHDDPLDDGSILVEQECSCRFHVHRCRRIEVEVCFNGNSISRKFSPAATLGRVKRWASRELGIERDDAAELVLQLGEEDVRPDPSTHLGSLVDCTDCQQKFDLVPLDRVNG